MRRDSKAPKLLRTVNGKPHASSDDHEEESRNRGGGVTKMSKEEEEEAARMADPLSSSEEEQEPAVRIADTSPPAATMASTEKKGENIGQLASRRIPRAKSMRVPRSGVYGYGRTDKAQRAKEDEKENEKSSPSVSGGKAAAEHEGEGSMFGWEHETKRAKTMTMARKTYNIHAGQTGKPKTFAGRHRVEAAKPKVSLFSDLNRLRDMKEDTNDPSLLHMEDAEDLSDVSLQSLKVPTPKRKRGQSAPGSKTVKNVSSNHPSPQQPKHKSLFEQLKTSRPDPSPKSSQLAEPHKSTHPNLDPNGSGYSTPLSSMKSEACGTLPNPPGESLQTLEQYIATLPSGVTDDKCPLCDAPVSQEQYWDFWKGKRPTIGFQRLFCRHHKKHEATEEYRQQGYPEIDWTTFPDKVARHHDRLLAVLRNEVPSQYRNAHAERVAAGQDRTVRTLLQKNKDIELVTGYYGSRGLRAMMETISSLLADDIRHCVETDRVVSFGGFANFLLKVLVPELTVCLVVEDCDVSEAKAREIIDKSGDLGAVVNEEVEDEVVVDGEEKGLFDDMGEEVEEANGDGDGD